MRVSVARSSLSRSAASRSTYHCEIATNGVVSGTTSSGTPCSRQAFRTDGRHAVVADEQAVADAGDVAAAQGADEPLGRVPPPAPDARGEHELVADEVGRGVGQLGDVDPADLAVEVAVDEQLEAERRLLEQVADRGRHWRNLQRQWEN